MDSPRGRLYLIRAAAEGRIGLTETFERHLDLCLGCRACESACPSGVPFGSLLEATRAQFRRAPTERRRAPADSLLVRLIFALFPEPARLGALLAPLKLYQRSGLRTLVRRSGLLRRFRARRWKRAAGRRPRCPLSGRGPRSVARHRRAPDRCVQRHLYPGINHEPPWRLLAGGGGRVIPRRRGAAARSICTRDGSTRSPRARAASPRAFRQTLNSSSPTPRGAARP